MPRSLPPDSQSRDGAAHRGARDLDVVMVPQVLHQQGCGPDRRAIAEVPWVRVDDFGDPGVDGTIPRAGAARPRGVGQPLPQAEVVAPLEPLRPGIDRPAADAEGGGDLLGRLTFVEPQEGLGPAPLPGDGDASGEVFQFEALPGGEYARC